MKAGYWDEKEKTEEVQEDGDGMLVQCLPSIHEAPGSIPAPYKQWYMPVILTLRRSPSSTLAGDMMFKIIIG